MVEDTSATPSEDVMTEELESSAESTDKPADGPVHPHLEEIMKCPPNEWQLEKGDPIPFKTLEETPYTIVDSKELLDEMMTKLREEKEIGLGTRRFTYRSFNGINCMIEIATRSEVFLVDTVTLKEEVKVLNEVLTNSAVLKVTHMGEGYVENMQKDLGLYLVNMFSLSVAWKSIHHKEIPRRFMHGHNMLKNLSQEALLKEHCGLEFEEFFKEFRTGGHYRDWHVRPLTEEKVKCSRIQVQYLLHIYDKLRNVLIDQSLLTDVYQKCNEACKRMWYPGKHNLHDKLHLFLYKGMQKRRRDGQLTKVQMEVFRIIHDWRHTTAQEHDEGRAYLLKDLSIYDIAKALPKNAEEIKNVLSPELPCPLLEENLEHVSEMIVKTVEGMSSAPDANEKVPFHPRARNSGAGVKRKGPNEGAPTKGKNGAKVKVPEPLEGKHPVSALAEHCMRSKIGMPEYSVVSEAGEAHKKTYTMNVTVEAVAYQHTEASFTKKHAKAMAASVALKTMGLIAADAEMKFT